MFWHDSIASARHEEERTLSSHSKVSRNDVLPKTQKRPLKSKPELKKKTECCPRSSTVYRTFNVNMRLRDGILAKSLKGRNLIQRCTDLLWHLKSTHVGSSSFAKSSSLSNLHKYCLNCAQASILGDHNALFLEHLWGYFLFHVNVTTQNVLGENKQTMKRWIKKVTYEGIQAWHSKFPGLTAGMFS